MQDRVPLYPGRVKLNPVSGQENTYDMVRADAPTQDGTPLSKDTFLKDSTAALFGLGTDAVPDDALAVLSRFHNGLGNEYVWSKNTGVPQYTETDTSPVIVIGQDENRVVYYSDSFTVNEDSEFELVNPQTYTFPISSSDGSAVLLGKYIITGTIK